MQDYTEDQLKQIKSAAKQNAKIWVAQNLHTMYQPTNDRQHNDNSINIFRNFLSQLRPDERHNLPTFYMLKYTIKLVMQIIDDNSDRITSACPPSDKPKSAGV